MTRSHKRGLKSLGPKQTTGPITMFSTWQSFFKWPERLYLLRYRLDLSIKWNCIACTFVMYQYLKGDKIDLRPLLQDWVTYWQSVGRDRRRRRQSNISRSLILMSQQNLTDMEMFVNEEIYTISLFISILTVPHRAKLPAANHGHRIKKLVWIGIDPTKGSNPCKTAPKTAS